MKTLLISSILFRRALAANDAETVILANAADGGSPFAIQQNNSFVVPYGEFPHKQGLQIFDRVAADALVDNHKGLLNKLVSWARGDKASYPVYVGHPDLPGSKDSDKRAYGWIENLRAENDGLHLDVKWSDAGRELVENAHFKFYSPLWWTKKVKGGIRPVGLKSMGLTNDPNIPVPALANEVETEDLETQDTREETESIKPIEPMNEIIAALGLEEGATPEEVLAKITALKDAAAEKEAVETKASKAETAKVESEEKIVELENSLSVESLALAAANDKVTALEGGLRSAVAGHVMRAALEGKVLPAEAEAKVVEILAANDIPAALEAMVKTAAKFKTSSTTGNLGSAKSQMVLAANDEGKARREERAALVEHEFQATNPSQSLGERKRIAWQRAQKKNPELFGKADSSGTAA
jgi:hypothetical protein